MYSMFGVRHSPNVSNIQQENNIQARKAGLQPRKPLAERKFNEKQEPAVSAKAKPVVTPNKQIMPIEIDLCSYKDVADNYEDLYISNQFFDPDDVSNIKTLFLGKMAKTPPYKLPKLPDFDLVESASFSNCLDYDLIMSDLKSMNFDEFDLGTEPMPDFDLI